jgi:hypothetical protein
MKMRSHAALIRFPVVCSRELSEISALQHTAVASQPQFFPFLRREDRSQGKGESVAVFVGHISAA